MREGVDSTLQQGFAAFFQDIVGGQTEDEFDAEAVANVVHPRDAEAAIAADEDADPRPDLAQAPDQVFQIVIGTQGGMNRPRPQGDHDELVGLGAGDEQGEVLILIEITMKEHQLLFTVGGSSTPSMSKVKDFGGVAKEAMN